MSHSNHTWPPQSSIAYNRHMAHVALSNARANLAVVWHSRHRDDEPGWPARYLRNDYPFWRKTALARVARCRVAVARAEMMWRKEREKMRNIAAGYQQGDLETYREAGHMVRWPEQK